MLDDFRDLHLKPAGRNYLRFVASYSSGWLRRYGIPPNTIPAITELHFAAWFNLPFTLGELLKTGAPANAREPLTGYTPLLLAVESGATNAAKALLDHPAIEPGIMDSLGRTPLSVSVENGHPIVVKLVIQHSSVDINAPDDKNCGWTVLFKAIARHRKDVVQVLLENSITDSTLKDYDDRTPLCLAIELGNEEIANMLAERDGYDLSFRDRYNGRSLLSWATKKGLRSTVRKSVAETLAQGASIDEKDNYGRTPLSYAASSGDEEVVRAILGLPSNTHPSSLTASLDLSDLRVDINFQDKAGRTPLYYAVDLFQRPDATSPVIGLLLSLGARGDVEDRARWSPLALAIRSGLADAAHTLGKVTEYDLAFSSADDRTLLSWAAQRGLLTIVEGLIHLAEQQESKEYDVDFPDIFGRTPLSYAAENGHASIVELLLKNGADPHTKDLRGRGLISHSRSGDSRTTLLLSKAGVNETAGRVESSDVTVCCAVKDGVKIYFTQT